MKAITQFLKRVLDVVLPPPPIEHFTLEDFSKKVTRARRGVKEISTSSILSALVYQDTLVKETIHALKYKESRHAAKLLANEIYPLILDYVSDIVLFDAKNVIFLVPIPLSDKRLRQRGYNQTLILAKEIMKISTDDVLKLSPDLLIRKKHTVPQTKTQSREERIKNIEGCFLVPHPDSLKDKDIILLDDVTTTGATLDEARRTVLRCGAKSVLALAVAH